MTMSRIEQWASQNFNAIVSGRTFTDCDCGDEISTNFGESIDHSEWCEGYGDGYDIRGCEPLLDSFQELPVKEAPAWMQELESAMRPGTGLDHWNNTPYEVELPIDLWTFQQAMEGTEEEPPMSFEDAFEKAAMVFAEKTAKAEAEMEAISKAIIYIFETYGVNEQTLWTYKKLVTGQPTRPRRKDESLRDYWNYISQSLKAKMPEPVVLKRDVVVDDLGVQNDAMSYHKAYDDAEWDVKVAEERALEGAKFSCFDSNMNKRIGTEEQIWLRQQKEEREERFDKYLSWVKRASRQALEKAFGRGGNFWKLLRTSRGRCFGRSWKQGDAPLLHPAQVWLTKAQVDALLKAKEERLAQLP